MQTYIHTTPVQTYIDTIPVQLHVARKTRRKMRVRCVERMESMGVCACKSEHEVVGNCTLFAAHKQTRHFQLHKYAQGDVGTEEESVSH